jgi:hypothetical protein
MVIKDLKIPFPGLPKHFKNGSLGMKMHIPSGNPGGFHYFSESE